MTNTTRQFKSLLLKNKTFLSLVIYGIEPTAPYHELIKLYIKNPLHWDYSSKDTINRNISALCLSKLSGYTSKPLVRQYSTKSNDRYHNSNWVNISRYSFVLNSDSEKNLPSLLTKDLIRASLGSDYTLNIILTSNFKTKTITINSIQLKHISLIDIFIKKFNIYKSYYTPSDTIDILVKAKSGLVFPPSREGVKDSQIDPKRESIILDASNSNQNLTFETYPIRNDEVLVSVYDSGELIVEYYENIIQTKDKTTIIRRHEKWIYEFEIKDGKWELKTKTKYYKQNNMKPVTLINNLSPQYVSVLDFETMTNVEGEIEPISIGIKSVRGYKSFFVLDFDTPSNMITEFLNHIKEERLSHIYAHNGGNFDFKLLLKYTKDINLKVVKHHIVEGSIVELTVKYNGYTIVFKDSYSILKSSLSKLSLALDTETKKGAFDYKKVNKKNLLEIKGELLDYLRGDCESLFEIMNTVRGAIFKRSQLDVLDYSTVSSLSNACWRSSVTKNGMIGSIKAINLDSELYEVFNKCHIGGSCEIYRDYSKEGTVYDVNSLYPSVMMNKKFPIGEPKYTTEKDLDKLYGVSFAKIDTKNLYSRGLLPYRQNGEITHPNGKFEGWYYTEELKEVRRLGYEIEIKESIHFEKSEYIFKDYIADYYELKLDKRFKEVGKLILNSSYGYLGLNKIQDSWSLNKGGKQKDELNINTIKLGKYNLNHNLNEATRLENNKINKLYAAIITAEARMFMLKYIMQDQVVYTDTDSIFVEGQIEIETHATEIGKFKKEYEYRELNIINKKVYAFIDRDTNEEVIKAAGHNIKSLKHSIFEDIIKGRVSSYIYSYEVEGITGELKTSKKRITKTLER